jgi:hypothetical protein
MARRKAATEAEMTEPKEDPKDIVIPVFVFGILLLFISVTLVCGFVRSHPHLCLIGVVHPKNISEVRCRQGRELLGSRIHGSSGWCGSVCRVLYPLL